MISDNKSLRIEGIYNQNDQGDFMMRIKLAGGVISTAQAATLARLSQQFGSGTLHLSIRGSIEFHDLRLEQIPLVQRGMATVGLFSRGACGGAVRGISCSTGFGRGFNHSQVLARKLLLHFTGNPHFEGLPKKFKIAVEADYEGSRHLIQDMALVFVDKEDGQPRYDVWLGGGLGRAPQAAILYRERVREKELLTLVEAVVRVYRDHVQPPKRLKSLISERGEGEFRRLLEKERAVSPEVQFSDAFDKTLIPVPVAAADLKLVVPVFAGELAAERLQALTEISADAGVEYLQVTADQDLALLPRDSMQRNRLVSLLTAAGFAGIDQSQMVLRVCPGSHECRMGLAATRKLAVLLHDRFGNKLAGRVLAVSGCPNSCAQPQLAEIGIIASKSLKEGGAAQRSPRYDLYLRAGEGLGGCVAERLDETELVARLEHLL